MTTLRRCDRGHGALQAPVRLAVTRARTTLSSRIVTQPRRRNTTINGHARSISRPVQRELGGRRRRVVVVVQTFAHGEEREPLEVRGGVVEGLAAEVWLTAFTAALSPRYMTAWKPAATRPDERAEHDHEERDADAEADEGWSKTYAVPTVPREVASRTASTCSGSLATLRYSADVAELHRDPAEQHGRVRVALDVGVRVVLAVHGHPLPGLMPAVIQSTSRKNHARPGRMVIARCASVRCR